MAKPLPKLERETTGLKVFPLFTLMGWALIGFAILISVIVLSPTGSAYFRRRILHGRHRFRIRLHPGHLRSPIRCAEKGPPFNGEEIIVVMAQT